MLSCNGWQPIGLGYGQTLHHCRTRITGLWTVCIMTGTHRVVFVIQTSEGDTNSGSLGNGVPQRDPGAKPARGSEGESFRICERGFHDERAEREPITKRSGGGAPSGVQGQSPWSWSQGSELPLSWNTFSFRTFNGSGKFAHFCKIWNAHSLNYFRCTRSLWQCDIMLLLRIATKEPINFFCFLHCVLKTYQLWNAIARNYKDRFRWNLTEIFKILYNRVCMFQFSYRFAFLSTFRHSNRTSKITRRLTLHEANIGAVQ